MLNQRMIKDTLHSCRVSKLMKNALKTGIAAFWLAACAESSAQTPTQTLAQPLTFSDYLNAVEQYSPQLQSAAQDVIAAEADIGIAKLRPDPELTLSTERERVRTGDPRPSTRGLELSWELETGGKRAARIRSAKSGVQLARAEAHDARRQLLLEASQAYIQACHDHHAWQRKQQTLAAFTRIAQANALRHQTGDIGGVEWRQSRLERDRYETEVHQAEADALAARLALMVPLGREWEHELQCDFLQHPPEITLPDLPQLIQHSLQHHGQIRATQAMLVHAQNQAKVAQSERWVNPIVSIGTERIRATPAGINHAGEAFDAAARSRTLMLSVSVPLPLSRRNRGELVQAHAAVTQATLALQQAKIEVQADIRALWHQCRSSLQNVQRYQTDILPAARQVLDGMQLAYQNGAASLLELLSAQHAADEVWLESLAMQAELAQTLTQLQLASGQRPDLKAAQQAMQYSTLQ